MSAVTTSTPSPRLGLGLGVRERGLAPVVRPVLGRPQVESRRHARAAAASPPRAAGAPAAADVEDLLAALEPETVEQPVALEQLPAAA
jgi:hypothetical protein